MKFISWNVNGLRACVRKGFFDFFNSTEADIFCVQEIKMFEEQADFTFPNYYTNWYSAEKKGYSGTAIFSKKRSLNAIYGMDIEEHDKEGRVITLEYENFYLVNVYTPNSKQNLLRLSYRKEWEDEFRMYTGRLNVKKPVLICGDLNVAHKEIDLKNPEINKKSPGFSDEEKAKFTDLLDNGFVDSFRYLYPTQEDAYTWWSSRTRARERNAGWRIDYFLVSKKLESKIKDSLIYKDVFISDHCPVGLIMDL